MQWSQYQCLISFHDLPIHDHLIEYIVRFFYIVHDVKLADIFKVLIHSLDQVMDKLQVGHLILLLQVDPDDEVQGSIATVDHLVPTVLDERAQGFVTG